MRRFVGVLLACALLVGCGGGSSGDSIVFGSDRDGDAEIFVMNADGTDVRQLTDNDNWNGFPSWSPDGDRIAFDSTRYGSNEIFVMNADGTDTYETGQKGWSPSFGG